MIRKHLVSLSAALAALACNDTTVAPDARVPGIQAMSFANSEWSTPVHVDAPVNSAASEQSPALSPDGLSLYFGSNRAGGLGGLDIWVSRRASLDSPWETPINLGPSVNSPSDENAASFSADGHLLFFFSGRAGGHGGNDIYMSRRDHTHDDFNWESPMNLGPDVNTAADETGPSYVENEDGGALYFNRGANETQDIYSAPLSRDGDTRGPGVLVAELNDPTVLDGRVSVRKDGREAILFSRRAGTLGLTDLWVSTRRSVNDPWSTPENLGAPINTAFVDTQASFSDDGRTLFFSSNRPGGLGGNDIYYVTRTPSGKEVP